jgi:4'-phosphopantetheinyl transferase
MFSNADQSQTARLICAAGEVHVWRVALDCAPTDLIALEAVLSRDERVRASSFATRRLSRRWIAARGALRTILSRYVGVLPESIVLKSDTNGKPKFAEVDRVLSFNLSHTDHLAFVAVAAGGCVGIDAEILQTDMEWDEISTRFFARVEIDEIKSLAP